MRIPASLQPIFKPDDLAVEIARERTRMREVIARSAEVLRNAEADTFLGRQRHEPIPLPHEEE